MLRNSFGLFFTSANDLLQASILIATSSFTSQFRIKCAVEVSCSTFGTFYMIEFIGSKVGMLQPGIVTI